MFPGFLRSRSRLSAFLRETWDASATTGLCCSTRGATLLKRFVAPSPSAVIPGGPPAASRDAPETPGKVDVVCRPVSLKPALRPQSDSRRERSSLAGDLEGAAGAVDRVGDVHGRSLADPLG